MAHSVTLLALIASWGSKEGCSSWQADFPLMDFAGEQGNLDGPDLDRHVVSRTRASGI